MYLHFTFFPGYSGFSKIGIDFPNFQTGTMKTPLAYCFKIIEHYLYIEYNDHWIYLFSLKFKSIRLKNTQIQIINNK